MSNEVKQTKDVYTLLGEVIEALGSVRLRGSERYYGPTLAVMLLLNACSSNPSPELKPEAPVKGQTSAPKTYTQEEVDKIRAEERAKKVNGALISGCEFPAKIEIPKNSGTKSPNLTNEQLDGVARLKIESAAMGQLIHRVWQCEGPQAFSKETNWQYGNDNWSAIIAKNPATNNATFEGYPAPWEIACRMHKEAKQAVCALDVVALGQYNNRDVYADALYGTIRGAVSRKYPNTFWAIDVHTSPFADVCLADIATGQVLSCAKASHLGDIGVVFNRLEQATIVVSFADPTGKKVTLFKQGAAVWEDDYEELNHIHVTESTHPVPRVR